MRQRKIRTLLGILLTVLMIVPVVTGDRPELFERFEHDLYDLRLRQFLSKEEDPRIVIVDIDEKSLAAEGRWPWNRSKLARMVDQLFDNYGVAIVGFDMVFSEADQSIDLVELKQFFENKRTDHDVTTLLKTLNSDAHFARVIADRPVVLGYLFDRSTKQLQVGHPGKAVIGEDPALAELPIPEANGVISSLNALQSKGVRNGFFDNPMVDSDGVYRRVPILQRFEGQYYPSLALAMMLALFEEDQVLPVIETDATEERSALVAVEAAGIRIPVDQHSAVLVPYRGPQGSFPYVSATDIINGVADPELLEGTIVLVGTSAAGLLDLRVTPMSNRYSGVEVHANILSGMLDGSFHHQPDYTLGVEIVQLIFCGLLLSIVIPRLSVFLSTIITLAIGGVVIALNLYAWQQLLWVIPLGYTLILISVLYLFQQTTGYFFETRNIAQLANQFGQYIPPEVVEELSQQDQSVQLSGESREMSVFFSDVRGFTSLSEQLTPQQLTRLMNIYLTGMTKVIHEQRGTVDKYIGDAVMAFWGAPLKDEDHARHALQAALEMLALLPELNQQLEREGLPAVRVGMGINSGIMNVGNMGSSFRMAYTVMGDAVNLGARLEGLTKYYGTPLLVSGELAQKVPEYLYRKLDRVQVKGRNEAVDVLEPIGLREQCTQHEKNAVDLFQKGIQAYSTKQWDEAQDIFEAYLCQATEDTMARIYLHRIAEYKDATLPADWCGVFSHTSK